MVPLCHPDSAPSDHWLRPLLLPGSASSDPCPLLSSPCRSEEANKAFSAAVQMHDVLVKAWAMWGDYLENIFVKDRQLHLGVSAITCYLHACRHQNESKSRKYLAKVSGDVVRILHIELPVS